MEKRELQEAHCPILKQTAKETSAPTVPAINQTSASEPQPAPEERKVTFDIGESDEGENKERRVAFDIGDCDDTDYSNENSGMFAKKQVVCY